MNPEDGKPPAKMMMKSIPRKKLPPVAAPEPAAAAAVASNKPIPRRSLPPIAAAPGGTFGHHSSSATAATSSSSTAPPTLHRLRKKKAKTSTRKLPLSSAASASASREESASASREASASAPRVRRTVQASPETNHRQHHDVGMKKNNMVSRGGNDDNNDSSNIDSSYNNHCVSILREDPLILKVKTTGIPFTAGLPAANRVSGRAPKRKLATYQDWDEMSNSDDYLTDSELTNQRQRKKKSSQTNNIDSVDGGPRSGLGTGTGAGISDTAGANGQAMADADMEPGPVAVVNGTGDVPPPGALSTLWYSRECFWHIFVLEKVVGWKTRTVFTLVNDLPVPVPVPVSETATPAATAIPTPAIPATTPATPTSAVVPLADAHAVALQQKAVQNPVVWSDYRRRMEISRIYPARCPVVLAMAATQEEQLVREEQQAHEKDPSTAPPPRALKYRLEATEIREEIILVKWRGRSHLHCSWERASDIQRLDPSNNTARNKIRRFYQSQEVSFGPEWKKVLEEEHLTALKIHSHGVAAGAAADEEVEPDEEYFTPQCLELERVLACDENELNMEVLAKQRALNLRAEQAALRRREEAESKPEEPTTDEDKTKATKAIKAVVHGLIDVTKKDEPWDPEDNVRYVVKWKGLPYSEITWEYWRDIKGDAVHEVEDFWFRQKAPDPEEVRKITTRTHPHIRDFRKVQASPQYGMSSRERPVADLGDGVPMDTEDDEGDADRGFRLRSYQLEGVNWLLFNWWNKRSCILADEMGL